MFRLFNRYFNAICFVTVFLSSKATALKCYECGMLEEDKMDTILSVSPQTPSQRRFFDFRGFGLMESVRQLNVSGLTNLHKQFPEDCPYTLDKDDSCSTQDFCVKIALSAVIDLSVKIEEETFTMQETENDMGAMRDCDRNYAPDKDATIEMGKCYEFSKTYSNDVGFFKIIGDACYCNDKDYCNGASRFLLSFSLVILGSIVSTMIH